MITVKERKEVNLMNVTGLCLTCKNKNTCIFLKNATRPIISCEEFENVETSTVIKEIITKEEPKEYFELKKGLCANCENRMDCKFEKPASGVWHCEEYR